MLTKTDYVKVLEYYSLPIPKTMTKIKQSAEKVLSLKLCKCIKKVSPSVSAGNEARAIGICTRNVFNKKGLNRGPFKCKNGRSVKFDKIKKRNTRKNTKY